MATKRRKGGHNCCIFDCTNGFNNRTTTHSLPQDVNTREKWIAFINSSYPNHYPGYTPTTATRICSSHFTSHDYHRHTAVNNPEITARLVAGAVPTALSRQKTPGVEQVDTQVSNIPIYTLADKTKCGSVCCSFDVSLLLGHQKQRVNSGYSLESM